MKYCFFWSHFDRACPESVEGLSVTVFSHSERSEESNNVIWRFFVPSGLRMTVLAKKLKP